MRQSGDGCRTYRPPKKAPEVTSPQEPRDGCVSNMLSLKLQKSPIPNLEEKCGNFPDISKGISQTGMCKFESSMVSQTVWRLKISPLAPAPPPSGRRSSNEIKARPWRAFANRLSVSGPRNCPLRERNRRKSPDTAANILVFRRRAPETKFDRHCVAGIH